MQATYISHIAAHMIAYLHKHKNLHTYSIFSWVCKYSGDQKSWDNIIFCCYSRKPSCYVCCCLCGDAVSLHVCYYNLHNNKFPRARAGGGQTHDLVAAQIKRRQRVVGVTQLHNSIIALYYDSSIDRKVRRVYRVVSGYSLIHSLR